MGSFSCYGGGQSRKPSDVYTVADVYVVVIVVDKMVVYTTDPTTLGDINTFIMIERSVRIILSRNLCVELV